MFLCIWQTVHLKGRLICLQGTKGDKTIDMTKNLISVHRLQMWTRQCGQSRCDRTKTNRHGYRWLNGWVKFFKQCEMGEDLQKEMWAFFPPSGTKQSKLTACRKKRHSMKDHSTSLYLNSNLLAMNMLKQILLCNYAELATPCQNDQAHQGSIACDELFPMHERLFEACHGVMLIIAWEYSRRNLHCISSSAWEPPPDCKWHSHHNFCAHVYHLYPS